MLALIACRPPSGEGPVMGPTPAPARPEAAETPEEVEAEAEAPVVEGDVVGGALARVSDVGVADLASLLGGSEERAELVGALDFSLGWFEKPSTRELFPRSGITHARAWASVYAFRSLLLATRDGSELERRIRAEFEFFASRGADGEGKVLYTGYYTPVYAGSRTRNATYRYPLYRAPSDLVIDRTRGEILGRRVGDEIVPYPTRAEIETSGMLAGLELVWLRDSFEVYLAHVQGSAAIRLPGGGFMQVSYAGSNGREYVSVSRALLRDGRLREDEISLEEVRAYFAGNPEELAPYVRRNPRFIFFQETRDDNWPAGSLGFKVTPLRSLATDKQALPPGGVVLVLTEGPDERGRIRPFRQFMLDQDSGGAIRTAGRADIYYGMGEVAERRAGGQYAEGRLFYLFLKPDRVAEWRMRMGH